MTDSLNTTFYETINFRRGGKYSEENIRNRFLVLTLALFSGCAHTRVVGASPLSTVFQRVNPAEVRNSTIPPDIIPARGGFSKVISPYKLLARAPIRDSAKTASEASIHPGILPNGENGIVLVVTQNGKEIVDKMIMGQVSGESELIDSQTGEILAQAIDTKTGKKYKITKSFTKWGQVKDIANDWAGSFRRRLDKLSGRK